MKYLNRRRSFSVSLKKGLDLETYEYIVYFQQLILSMMSTYHAWLRMQSLHNALHSRNRMKHPNLLYLFQNVFGSYCCVYLKFIFKIEFSLMLNWCFTVTITIAITITIDHHRMTNLLGCFATVFRHIYHGQVYFARAKIPKHAAAHEQWSPWYYNPGQ